MMLLFYSTDDPGSDGRLDVCVAVVNDNQMVVVSTTVDPDSLLKLVEMHLPKGELRNKLKLAKI
jgi:hypothetical protein